PLLPLVHSLSLDLWCRSKARCVAREGSWSSCDKGIKLCWKKYPSRSYKCGKPFPLYPKLEYVFGVDRATGVLGELPQEADEVLADGDEGEGDTGLVDPPVRPSNPNDQTATFPDISTNPSTTSGSKKRKKSSDNLDILAGAIVNGIENYGVYVEKLADAMIGKDPTRVIGSELKRLGLTPNQSVIVAMKMSRNPDIARYFWEMDDEQRQELIKTLLFD
ncbi:hypothetical protein Tsubulata_006035, partial [Turnera subulata]